MVHPGTAAADPIGTMPAGRLGACHAVDLPFVFDTLPSVAELFWRPADGGADEVAALAAAVQRRWVAFASSGDSGGPEYREDEPVLLRIEPDERVVTEPRAPRLATG